MSNPSISWRNYGGIHKLDNFNNVSVHSFVADLFTLRQSYYGTFDISGELHVSGNAHIDSNIYGNNIFAYNDLSTNQLYVVNKTYHYNDVDICGNLTVHDGNVHLLQNMDLSGHIYLRNELYLGNSFAAYLYGTDISGNIGVNTHTPIAAVDISSGYPLAFNVGSATQSQIYAVPLKNNANKGFVLSANTTTSQLGFHNDSSITNPASNQPDAFIQYASGGILTIDTSSNVNLLSTISMSNRQSTAHIMGETVAIYDTSAGPFLYPIYQNVKSITGNALSLIANDACSNTFMNTVAANGQGLSVGGGMYPNDSKRSFGSIGWRDQSANYTPSINIVSGNSHIRQKTTVGINTHAPTTESYAFDVNGPIRGKNGELTITKQADFEIIAIASGRSSASNNAVAIGSPYKYISGSTYAYKHKILYTDDGGENWYTNYDLSGSNFERQNNYLRCAYVFDSSITIIAGDDGYAFYTSGGYTTILSADLSDIWQSIVYSAINVSATIKSVYMNSSRRVFFGVNETGQNSKIFWFDFPTSSINEGLNVITQNLTRGQFSTSSMNNIAAIDGCGNSLWIAYGSSIAAVNNVNGSPSLGTVYTNTFGRTYTTISAFDANNVVAAGVNIITYTKNGGASWIDVSLNGFATNKLFVCDASNALAVCNSGVVLSSTNGYATWSAVSNQELNVSGNANRLLDQALNLTNVAMVDTNNFYITQTIQTFNGTQGNTNLFHCYLPNLFNNVTNYIFDLHGSARIYGDWNIQSGGKLASNNATFYLLDNSVNQINIGGDASYVYLASTQNGTVVSRYNLNVLHDTSLNGNLQVGGNVKALNYEGLNQNSDIYIGGLFNVNGGQRNIKVGNFTVSNYATNQIYLGGVNDNLILGGNVKINNNLQIGSYLNVNYTLGSDPAFAGSSTAAGTGILFADCSLNNRGYFVVSSDLTGYIFKSVQKTNNNMIKLDVSNMIVPVGQSSALTYLYPTPAGSGTDSNYTVGICPVDPSNITQLNKAKSSPSQQTIDISSSFVGPLSIGKYPANPSYPLEISGNVYHPYGYIWQF